MESASYGQHPLYLVVSLCEVTWTLSPVQVATALYRGILEREADLAGLKSKVKRLRSDSLEQVVRTFITSPEFRSRFLERLVPPLQLPDLRALMPDKYEIQQTSRGAIGVYVARDASDATLMASLIEKHRYYDRFGAWTRPSSRQEDHGDHRLRPWRAKLFRAWVLHRSGHEPFGRRGAHGARVGSQFISPSLSLIRIFVTQYFMVICFRSTFTGASTSSSAWTSSNTSIRFDWTRTSTALHPSSTTTGISTSIRRCGAGTTPLAFLKSRTSMSGNPSRIRRTGAIGHATIEVGRCTGTWSGRARVGGRKNSPLTVSCATRWSRKSSIAVYHAFSRTLSDAGVYLRCAAPITSNRPQRSLPPLMSGCRI